MSIRYGKPVSQRTTTGDYYLDVAKGLISDSYAVHKFGLAEEFRISDGLVDIWDGAAIDIGGKIPTYNWIDNGAISLQISSDSSSDVGILISGEGLDDNWGRVFASATLNGQNAVTVLDDVGAPILANRIYRAYNDSAIDLTGNVFVSEAGTALSGGRPVDDTKIHAIIHAHAQQTEMALYTVPDGHQMQLVHGWSKLSKAIAAEVNTLIYRRTQGGVFRVLDTGALQTTGTSIDHRPYTVPLTFGPREDIIYRCITLTNDVAVSAGFHAIVEKL